jgi:outer membrane protein assembly factor BamB
MRRQTVTLDAMRTLPLLAVLLAFPLITTAADWPAWRGPKGDGISTEKNLPLTWSATDNVAWKVPLPEPGNSTPIVAGGRVFLTQNVGNRRTLLCIDRKDGRTLWQAGPTHTDRERTHPTNPYCSASPVTDGERVIAFFGSAGLWCWDVAGREQWRLDLGKQDHEWGYAGSPVLHGDLCILNFGPDKATALIAVNKRTGKEAWRVPFPAITPKLPRNDGFGAASDGMIGSWSTPLVIDAAGRAQLLMTWPERLASYDPTTGKELWTCSGLNPLIYTSPMFGEGTAIGSGGYGGSTIAVKLGGSGDVTESHRLWHKPRDKQRIGSGVITGGHLYILNTPGTAQCIELASGKTVWEERLKGESWSSMVLAGDRIYVLNQAADTFVLRAAPKFEQLAVNSIGDGRTNASHSMSDGQVFIRTHKHLWCVGKGG